MDAETRTVEVTGLAATRTYAAGESISSPLFEGSIPVDAIFSV